MLFLSLPPLSNFASLWLTVVGVTIFLWMQEEVITRLEHEKKSALLQKQEEENLDWTKTDKTRSAVESLEADIVQLQQSIRGTCSSILQLIDEELYPQLVAITSG